MSNSLPIAESPCSSAVPPGPALLQVCGLTVTARGRTLLHNIHLDIPHRQVFGIIGPSGAGKSTLLKCINRLAELTPGFHISGDVLLEGKSIYARGVNADEVRSRIGILFQQPVIFPGSIYQNVIFGISRLGAIRRADWPTAAEEVLREAALWDEVKDRLGEPANRLSIGQQQRLCLARTLASKPDVILMDEPTSALDPIATEAIEELILRLKQRHTVVLVAHNLRQARRVTDWLACLCIRNGVGEVVESACCDQMLTQPSCQAAIEYLKHA